MTQEIMPTPADADALLDLDLAAKVQTNITLDHNEALRWGYYALSRATLPKVRANHPYLGGRVASMMGLRAEMAGRAPEEVGDQFDEADSLLLPPGDARLNDPELWRERGMMHALYGRALAIRAARQAHPSKLLRQEVHQKFATAELQLNALHTVPFSRWDRYAAMATRHWITYEAIDGNPFLAAGLSIVGMWRAFRADNEGQAASEHKEFVEKHVRLSAAAGRLALDRLFNHRAEAANTRRMRGLSMLIGYSAPDQQIHAKE